MACHVVDMGSPWVMSTRISFLYGDFTHEAVYLAVDRNGDGDVADSGEISVFFDENNASGLAAPAGSVLDIVQARDGSVFYGDNPTDSVYRLVDRNGDGDAQDAGEAKVWFSAAGNAAGFVMPTPNGVSVGADGAVYIVNAGVVSGPVDDVVYRTVDRNRDGDAQDAGEAKVWLDLQTLNPTSSAFEISFTGEIAYITDTNGSAPDTIYRAVDSDRSGRIEADEVVTFIADNSPLGVNVEYPHDSLGETVYAFEFAKRGAYHTLYALNDRDGSGQIDSADEARVVWDASHLPSGYVISTGSGMDAVADGSILLAANGSQPNQDHLVRLVDSNGDGDFLDSGETTVIAAKVDGNLEVERVRPVETYRQLAGDSLPDLVYGSSRGETLDAGRGPARIFGFDGNDRLLGGGSDDELVGGAGRDTLLGGRGGDRLDGGRGADTVFGGQGADLFVIGHDDAVDTIFDFNRRQGDRIRIELPDAIVGSDGEVSASLLRLSTGILGTSLQVDSDYDASNGFQAKTVALIVANYGLSLAAIVDNDLV